MTGVSNGLGASTTVTYGRLNDPTVYTKGTGAIYPLQDMIGAEYVVSKLASSDGVERTRTREPPSRASSPDSSDTASSPEKTRSVAGNLYPGIVVSYLSSRERRRSLSTLPSVWQVGQ